MVDYLARPVVHEAFFKKYASKKFLKGKSLLFMPRFASVESVWLTRHAASILTRQWAKKAANHFGITDTHLSLDQISGRDDYDYQ